MIPIQGVVLISLDPFQKRILHLLFRYHSYYFHRFTYTRKYFRLLKAELLFGWMRYGFLLFLFMFAWREASLFVTRIVSWEWMLMPSLFVFFCIIYWTPCPSSHSSLSLSWMMQVHSKCPPMTWLRDDWKIKSEKKLSTSSFTDHKWCGEHSDAISPTRPRPPALPDTPGTLGLCHADLPWKYISLPPSPHGKPLVLRKPPEKDAPLPEKADPAVLAREPSCPK